MFRDRLYLTAVLVSLCVSSLGLCKKQLQLPERRLAPLVPVELLEQARLTTLWESKLALSEPERLQRLFMRGDGIYGLTDRNYLFGLNRSNGIVRFGTSLVSVGLLVLGPQLFGNDLFFTAGNSLLQINTEFGREISSKRFSFTVTAPIARNAKYIYVAGSDRRLHVFDASSRLEEFEVAADNDSIITSILAEDEYVVFSTQEGNIISISPAAPLRNWQFDATGAISAQLVADGPAVFASCQDTTLYKLNARTGRMLWKFHTGAKLVKPTWITRKVVYQHARYHGLYAIDKETGKQIWQLADGKDLLTESNQKAYVITDNGTVVVMDNRTGKIIDAVGFAGVLRYVSGSLDSLIYIGDDAGRLACLKPTR